VQIEVQMDLQANALVLGSAAELREVLTNLVFNAVDAMPSGGWIYLASTTSGENVTISVTDTGTGMSADDRARCLEPFFTTKGERGTGLGLSVVYGIIQRHSGTIDIASELGRGTTFTITLPVTSSTLKETTANVGDAAVRPLRVLVADDQDVICELIAEYLRAEGHEVEVALDGTEALSKFDPARFDLVVTDQSMPGMSGEQLAGAINDIASGTPVILLTGFGDEMRDRGSLPTGIRMIVGKPVTAADLRRAVLQVLAEEAPAAEAAA
jgi:CheY-like chemotaxis protein